MPAPQGRVGKRTTRRSEIAHNTHKQGPTMITEIAQIDVKPGTEAEFEKGVKQAIPIFKRAKGCRSMELRRSIEKPSRYRLFVGWDTVETTPMIFAARPTSRNGASWSATTSLRRRMWNT
jgi:hypothetical protein